MTESKLYYGYFLKEILEDFNLSFASVDILYQKKLLSFNPSTRDSLTEGEFLEIKFISSLYNSGLSFSSVETLLSKLDRPNGYYKKENCFDFSFDRWRDLNDKSYAIKIIYELIESKETENLIEIKSIIDEYIDRVGK